MEKGQHQQHSIISIHPVGIVPLDLLFELLCWWKDVEYSTSEHEGNFHGTALFRVSVNAMFRKYSCSINSSLTRPMILGLFDCLMRAWEIPVQSSSAHHRFNMCVLQSGWLRYIVMAASFQGAISVLGKRKLSLSEKSNFLEKSENKYIFLYKVINQYFCGNKMRNYEDWLGCCFPLNYGM